MSSNGWAMITKSQHVSLTLSPLLYRLMLRTLLFTFFFSLLSARLRSLLFTLFWNSIRKFVIQTLLNFGLAGIFLRRIWNSTENYWDLQTNKRNNSNKKTEKQTREYSIKTRNLTYTCSITGCSGGTGYKFCAVYNLNNIIWQHTNTHTHIHVHVSTKRQQSRSEITTSIE